MTQKNDGGPAHPVMPIYTEDQHMQATGLSIRDYFASAALQGMCANPANPLTLYEGDAENAYRFAAAMIRERDK